MHSVPSATLATPRSKDATMVYGSVEIEGVRIAYREAGSPDRPTIFLLHGVPSWSRMYDGLMRRLAHAYHLVALDYPGFGNSDAPSPSEFRYTFDRLAEMAAQFADTLGLGRYVLFMQDYGAPVGMRLAEARPDAVVATIFQNGNVYDEGLGPIWARRRAYWADRQSLEAEVIRMHLSVEVTRGRHIGSDPDIAAYDPDLWMDEVAYLNRPGIGAIQAELIFDYQHNFPMYPGWQQWLRSHQRPALVLWGKYDQAFIEEGAQAFRRDLPDATITILDAGHFAMDTRLDSIVEAVSGFMKNV